MPPRTPVALICLAPCLPSASNAKADDTGPAPDLAGFPKLTGKLEQLLGHDGGFARPKPGEPFRLALADLAGVHRLEFDPARKSHIPLPGPVRVEAVRYYPNGAFESLRLVAAREGGGRVVIDIVPKSGLGRDKVLVWVVIEGQVVQGVALVECEADGAFPKRRK